jgi:hypothetical protein
MCLYVSENDILKSGKLLKNVIICPSQIVSRREKTEFTVQVEGQTSTGVWTAPL